MYNDAARKKSRYGARADFGEAAKVWVHIGIGPQKHADWRLLEQASMNILQALPINKGASTTFQATHAQEN
jgi:hypothetical protein